MINPSTMHFKHKNDERKSWKRSLGANAWEGRGSAVQRGILEGPQDAARGQEKLLPARSAGRMVPALQTHVAVVPDRRPSTELARPFHRENDSDCLRDCHRFWGRRGATSPKPARSRIL